MIVRTAAETPERTRADGVVMRDFFGDAVPAGPGVSMGHASFPPGCVVPPASHTGDEYAYVLKGCMTCESAGVVHRMHAGEASFIPAGEEHTSRNEPDEEAVVVWMLVERP